MISDRNPTSQFRVQESLSSSTISERISKVWSNSGATLHDIGDGVLNLEFRDQNEHYGQRDCAGYSVSPIEIAEKDFRGR